MFLCGRINLFNSPYDKVFDNKTKKIKYLIPENENIIDESMKKRILKILLLKEYARKIEEGSEEINKAIILYFTGQK